jgi:serine/threonine protein kinase
LLYNLLEASFLLEPLGRRIGDVHPSNIVLNEKGRLKIIPVGLLPNSKNGYQKIIEERISDVYLGTFSQYIAPEEIDEILIEKGIYPIVDSSKAEIFSIGLTLLMAASLLDSYYLYDRKVLKFNSSKKQ